MIKVRKLLTSLTSSWNLLDTKLASGTSTLRRKDNSGHKGRFKVDYPPLSAFPFLFGFHGSSLFIEIGRYLIGWFWFIALYLLTAPFPDVFSMLLCCIL